MIVMITLRIMTVMQFILIIWYVIDSLIYIFPNTEETDFSSSVYADRILVPAFSVSAYKLQMYFISYSFHFIFPL